MIRKIRLNYILASEATQGKLDLACEELGWSRRSIVKQTLHGFMRRDGRFYAEAGIKDAAARGMSEAGYFRILRDRKESELSPYLGDRPIFGQTPIDHIPRLPTDKAYRRAHTAIGLSAYNYVLLKVARIVDGGAIVQVLSRMIIKHFDDNWETSYMSQIARDKDCKFL